MASALWPLLLLACFAFRQSTASVTRTLAIIKPDAFQHTAQIESEMKQAGFRQITKTTVKLDRAAVAQFYEEHETAPFFRQLTAHVSSGVVSVYVLERRSAVQMWRAIMGPTDPALARGEMPLSIRARFGSDITRNAVHGSSSLAAAKREIAYFFADRVGMEGVQHEEALSDVDLLAWNITVDRARWSRPPVPSTEEGSGNIDDEGDSEYRHEAL